MRCLGGLLFAVAALAAEDDPTGVLLRLREQVTAHGRRIPNHTCIETVRRDRTLPVGTPPKSCDDLLARGKRWSAGAFEKAGIMDRMRFDVALADGREIYSWAGAPKFEEGDIDQFIHDGPIGTGPFAAMLLAIFSTRNPRFFYDGEITPDGRRLMQFSFTTQQEQSEYRVKVGPDWWITGYTGTLLVEPLTATLLRLTIRTNELPRATTACETDTTLDYATVQLGGLGYLLPKIAHQRFISRDGSEAENTITFASCREYQSESTLSFADGPVPVEVARQSGPTETPAIPPDLLVNVELAAGVSLDQAAAGDRVDGRLVSPLRDSRQRLLAPAGTAMSGRLMRVETRFSSPRETTVALRWETIDLNGISVPISLNPARNSIGGLNVNAPIGAGQGSLKRRGFEIDLPPQGEDRYAIFYFGGDRPVMKAGLRSAWVTVKP